MKNLFEKLKNNLREKGWRKTTAVIFNFGKSTFLIHNSFGSVGPGYFALVSDDDARAHARQRKRKQNTVFVRCRCFRIDDLRDKLSYTYSITLGTII